MRDDEETARPEFATITVRSSHHNGTRKVTGTLLSSGTVVITGDHWRITRAGFCKKSPKECPCVLFVDGGEIRPGAGSEKMIAPLYLWRVHWRSGTVSEGKGFNLGECFIRARKAYSAQPINPEDSPARLLVLQCDPRDKPGVMPECREVYRAEIPAPAEKPREHVPRLYPFETPTNPGHGDDSEPLDLDSGFRFDDSDSGADPHARAQPFRRAPDGSGGFPITTDDSDPDPLGD